MFEVLGYIFAAIIIVYAIINIVVACINCFRDENLIQQLQITHAGYMSTELNEVYIIPTINVMYGRYFTICFRWIVFNYEITFHLQDEEEIDSIVEARMNKRND